MFLLTSFTTWKSHQSTNSSDDLLQQVSASYPHPEHLRLLRQLPVNAPEAIAQTLTAIHYYQPQWVISCGMAETRPHLSIEAQATQGHKILQPALNLNTLTAGLDALDISQDAGKFVCETLYYAVLETIQTLNLPTDALFIHVPILHSRNRSTITNTFLQILYRLHQGIGKHTAEKNITQFTVND